MASSPFLPQGNGVAIAATTTTANIAMPNPTAPAIVVTNPSTTSSLWVNWGATSAVTAAFPVAGNTTGSPGIAVAPGAQVSIGTNGLAAYVAVILATGSGTVYISAGDGV